MTEAEIRWMEEDIKANARQTPEDFTQWFWFGLIEKLCMGDVLKWDAVLSEPFLKCLNLLTYWVKVDKDREQQARRQMEAGNTNKLANF